MKILKKNTWEAGILVAYLVIIIPLTFKFVHDLQIIFSITAGLFILGIAFLFFSPKGSVLLGEKKPASFSQDMLWLSKIILTQFSFLLILVFFITTVSMLSMQPIALYTVALNYHTAVVPEFFFIWPVSIGLTMLIAYNRFYLRNNGLAQHLCEPAFPLGKNDFFRLAVNIFFQNNAFMLLSMMTGLLCVLCNETVMSLLGLNLTYHIAIRAILYLAIVQLFSATSSWKKITARFQEKAYRPSYYFMRFFIQNTLILILSSLIAAFLISHINTPSTSEPALFIFDYLNSLPRLIIWKLLLAGFSFCAAILLAYFMASLCEGKTIRKNLCAFLLFPLFLWALFKIPSTQAFFFKELNAILALPLFLIVLTLLYFYFRSDSSTFIINNVYPNRPNFIMLKSLRQVLIPLLTMPGLITFFGTAIPYFIIIFCAGITVATFAVMWLGFFRQKNTPSLLNRLHSDTISSVDI